jgi:crossover junction endodeoxyribonuclease RusA
MNNGRLQKELERRIRVTKSKKNIKNETLNYDNPSYPKQILEFVIGLPPSVNHMYIHRGGSKILTKQAKEYIIDTQNTVIKQIRESKWKKDKEHVWYYMDLYFYFPDKRIRDSHNCIKLLMDSLEGLLFHNDYFVMPRIQQVVLDKNNPRLEVTFFPK